jgi:hypothetical protein
MSCHTFASGYLQGRIKIFALWFNPLGGQHGRISAVVEHGGASYVVDMTCARKFVFEGETDSLRRGWEMSRTTRDAIQDKAQRGLNRAGRGLIALNKDEASQLRGLAYRPGPSINGLFLLAGQRTAGKLPVAAWRIWPNGHFGEVSVGWDEEFLNLNDIPDEVNQLIEDRNAILPGDRPSKLRQVSRQVALVRHLAKELKLPVSQVQKAMNTFKEE